MIHTTNKKELNTKLIEHMAYRKIEVHGSQQDIMLRKIRSVQSDGKILHVPDDLYS